MQATLRKVIEYYSDNCRNLLAVNGLSKLLSAIRCRLKAICCGLSPIDRIAVKNRLIERYESNLSENGIAFDRQRLSELVGIYFPDLRSIANHIEFEFAC